MRKHTQTRKFFSPKDKTTRRDAWGWALEQVSVVPSVPWASSSAPAPPRAWASAGLRTGSLSPCLSHAQLAVPCCVAQGREPLALAKGSQAHHASCEDANVSLQVLHFVNVQEEPLRTPRMEDSVGKARRTQPETHGPTRPIQPGDVDWQSDGCAFGSQGRGCLLASAGPPRPSGSR